MINHALRIFLFYILLAWSCEGSTQSESLPVAEWKSKLSLKNDPGRLKFLEVYNAIIALDSSDRCQILHLWDQSSSSNSARFQIRFNILRTYLAGNHLLCPDEFHARQSLEQSLLKAYEMEDPYMTVMLYQALSAVVESEGDFSLGIMYSLIAVELMDKTGFENFNNVSLSLSSLGDKFYHSKDYRESLSKNLLAIHYHGRTELNKADSLDNNQEMSVWNTVGLCYKRLEVYDSAFWAFQHALVFASVSMNDDNFWYGLIQGNRGDVFFEQEQYDSAQVLLQFDYKRSMSTGYFDNASLSLQRLARIKNLSGDHLTALKMLQRADSLERKWSNTEYRNTLMKEYAMVYKDLGKADSVYKYLEAYRNATMDSEKKVAQSKMDIIHLRMNNQKNEHYIQQLYKEKSRIKLIRNFIVFCILLGTIAGFLYFNRLRLQMRLRQQEALERERIAAADAALVKEQLSVFTKNLIEKSSLVENLQAQLLHKELSNELNTTENELSQFTILTDEDWEKFKMLFESVHPMFFASLKSKAPGISLAEQRMAALSKLQVPARQAATILGISPNSVHKNRQRLRHRLGLETDADLDSYFAGKISE